jgi:hypothetical protein
VPGAPPPWTVNDLLIVSTPFGSVYACPFDGTTTVLLASALPLAIASA